MREGQDILPLGNRNAQHSFSRVPNVHSARSQFNRSFAVKDTFDFDELIPIFVDEVLPGDTANVSVKSFARIATQVNPVMDNMYLDFFFFYVPTRLVWDNFTKMMGEQVDPGDSIDYTVPTYTVNNGSGIQGNTLWDHMGLPTDVDDLSINALPFRCYQLIYNDWFRDQNLQDSDDIETGDTQTVLPGTHRRNKKHDYFTSALPWPQKGDAVSFLTGTVPVITSTTEHDTDGADAMLVRESSSGAQLTADRYLSTGASGVIGGTSSAITNQSSLYPSNLYANLAADTANTLNQFRLALMTQSLIELDARGGTRYKELIKAHFNVVVPDHRLQRPEFLGGGTTQINQHPVPATAHTSGTDYQANLAAFSTSANVSNRIGFTKSFVEHGYVIGIVCGRADITYQQGINRMWSRSTRYDFFWPKLQELGEQSILTKEIYAQGSTVDTGSTGTPDDERVWGYQERYAEYRYKPSEIRGQFRSQHATSLDSWHLAEEFSTKPSLNTTFIKQNTPIERSLAVAASYPHVLFDCWFDYKHARPMVTYGVPATLGRF
jgi:hypothetical protein